MGFPRKFKALLETKLNDVESPDYLWLTYAVCAMSTDACGWGGWIVDGAFKKTDEKHPTGTGDKLLNTACEAKCPQCGKDLFRTEASVRYEPSEDQTPVHGLPGVDYDVSPIEYD